MRVSSRRQRDIALNILKQGGRNPWLQQSGFDQTNSTVDTSMTLRCEKDMRERARNKCRSKLVSDLKTQVAVGCLVVCTWKLDGRWMEGSR